MYTIYLFLGKDDTGMTDVLKQALKEFKDEKREQLLKRLKMAYLTHRQISAAEAVYRIFSGMHMKDSNTKCAFLQTGFQENRSQFFKSVCDDGNETEDNDRTIKLEGRSGNFIKSVTTQEKYEERPVGMELVCLATFGANYESVKTVPKKTTFTNGSSNDGEDDTLLPKYIQLQNEKLGYMSRRGHPCVLRLHNPRKKEGHEQYYAELLAFYPWRKEEEDLHRNDPENCIKLYFDNIEVLNGNKQETFPYSKEVREVQAAIEDGTFDKRPSHIFDMLASQAAQDNDDANIEGMIDDPTNVASDHNNLDEGQRRHAMTEIASKFRKIEVEEEETLLKMTRTLVQEQMFALQKIVAFCKNVVKARSGTCEDPDPVLITIQGGAGKYI
jgi:hypothetical protein